MALIVSAASGNFNAGATWVGGVVPSVGDTAQAANGHTITITANAACTLINNAGTGTFILSNGVTLTANIEKGNTATPSVQLSGSNSASIVGNVTGPNTGPPSNHYVVANSSSGALSITGNITGGSAGSSGPQGVSNGAGTLNVTGNVSAGTGGNSVGVFSTGIVTGIGTVNVTGNVTGGTGGQIGNKGIDSTSAGTISVIGTVAAGTLTNAHAIRSSSTTSTVVVVGVMIASNTIAAVQAGNSGTHQFSGSFIFSENGTVPVDCLRYRLNTTPTTAKTRYALNGSGTYVDMFTADNTGLAPAVGDVRAGTVYGSATGTLAVPPANSVAFGVAVDNTTGTAVLTLANVQSALTAQGLTSSRAGNLDNLDTTVSSRLSPSGTLATVTTLTNAPSVPSASAIASQVRSELSVELSRIDAATSTRATPANIPTAEITAIKVKTDALNTTRLAQVSTTEILGNLLAQANS